MDYLTILEETFSDEDHEGESRLEFLAENIFGFTTYESQVSSFMGLKAIQVCKAISERTTFDYISNDMDNLWYLVMVNMPFFENKIEWGCSIRGAWWDLCGDSEFVIDCDLTHKGVQLIKLFLDKYEWNKFIEAMITFAKEEDEL